MRLIVITAFISWLALLLISLFCVAAIAILAAYKPDSTWSILLYFILGATMFHMFLEPITEAFNTTFKKFEEEKKTKGE